MKHAVEIPYPNIKELSSVYHMLTEEQQGILMNRYSDISNISGVDVYWCMKSIFENIIGGVYDDYIRDNKIKSILDE